jgi:hypothetical protein
MSKNPQGFRHCLEEELRQAAMDDVGADREHPLMVSDDTNPAASKKRKASSPIDIPDSDDDAADADDGPVRPKSPSQLRNRPLFCSPYKFTKPDVIVFLGMMFLTFDTEEDAQEGKSSKATGAYCQLCDTHFKYNMNTNPHTVTNHA